MPGLSQFGLSAIAADADPTLMGTLRPFDGAVIYAEGDGPAHLVIHDRMDEAVLVIDTALTGDTHLAVFTQWHDDGIAIHNGPGIDLLTVPSSLVELIPASDVTVTPAAMRVDTSGRLIIANSSGARRFHPDLTVDTTVSFTTPADFIAIDPGGDYVYGVGKGPSTTLIIRRWSIDSGGGAPITIATETATNWGQPGIAVDSDGGVIVAVAQLTGTGNFLTDPYVKAFLVFRYVVGAAAYDLTSALPDSTGGRPNPGGDPGIYINVGYVGFQTQMTTDQYHGVNHAWFVLVHFESMANNAYITSVDVDAGVVEVLSLHRTDDSLKVVGDSGIGLVFSGTPTFPGEGRRTAADSAGGTFQFGPVLP